MPNQWTQTRAVNAMMLNRGIKRATAKTRFYKKFPKGFFRKGKYGNREALTNIVKALNPVIKWRRFNPTIAPIVTIGGLQNTIGFGATNVEYSIADVNDLRSIYNKVFNDCQALASGPLTSAVANDDSIVSPPLVINYWRRVYTFTNTASTTCYIKAIEMISKKPGAGDPVALWLDDIQGATGTGNGNVGLLAAGTTQTPNTAAQEVLPSVNDPGQVPYGKYRQNFNSYWSVHRVKDYIVPPGQTVRHVINMPPMRISKEKLYDPLNGPWLERLSIQLGLIVMGERVYDNQAGVQGVLGRSDTACMVRMDENITLKGVIRARTSYQWTTESDYTNTSRSLLYPVIATGNQAVMSGAGYVATDQLFQNMEN